MSWWKLEEVNSEADVQFLYELLKERTSEMVISFKMPSFEQHKRFVASKPYLVWYIIKDGGVPVGTVYKTKHDEIGIQIKKDCWRRGYASWAIRQLYHLGDGRNLANINPKNERSIALFKSLGFELIQYTFELKK